MLRPGVADIGVERAEFGVVRNLGTFALDGCGEDRLEMAISSSPSFSNGRFVPNVAAEAIFL